MSEKVLKEKKRSGKYINHITHSNTHTHTHFNTLCMVCICNSLFNENLSMKSICTTVKSATTVVKLGVRSLHSLFPHFQRGSLRHHPSLKASDAVHVVFSVYEETEAQIC